MTKEERKELAAKRSSEVNKGNTNSSKINRLLGDTLKRKLIQDEAIRANKVVDALITKAEDGDVHAIKEVLDRTDGKVVQESKISGDSDEPLMIKVITGINDND
jgi:ribosomal protein L17|tara:strand:- start:977 stop:1288 length:312 start_codon:yes stop_codon:yes gene_type:complete